MKAERTYKKQASRTLVQKKNRTGLPDNLKAGIENLSGYSMDDVRVHYGSSKPAAVQAYAYTQGTDIYVAPGQERHLPHEAWHVAQQMAGRVAPTTEINGMPVMIMLLLNMKLMLWEKNQIIIKSYKKICVLLERIIYEIEIRVEL